LSRAGEVKIADFGIAVAAVPGRTGSGVRKIMGKWRYMSPEQARGEELDTRSDLFSAAAVMFELFTGEKLFPGDEAEDIIRNIHEMALPKASSVRPGLPARLDTILHAALSRRPTERPPRAAAIQRALTELSYESSIVATALDVAEAVNSVVEGKPVVGRTSLDDLIRKQLGGQAPVDQTVSRNTAVETRNTAVGDGGPYLPPLTPVTPPVPGVPQAIAPTGSGRTPRATTKPPPLPPPRPPKMPASSRPPADKPLETIEETGRVTLVQSVDDDGVSVLELDDLTVAAVPRAIRAETSGGVSRPVTAPHLAAVPTSPSQSMPRMPAITGSAVSPVPGVAVNDGLTPTGASVAPRPRTGSKRWPLVILGSAALGALAVVLVLRRPSPAPAAVEVPVAVDAGAAAATGILELDSVPPGATASIDGKKVGVTPARIDVTPGRPLVVKLSLAAHDPYVDDRVVVEPGRTVRIRAILAAARARLRVTSDPPGATVLLAERPIGETPVTLDDLEPGKDQPLALTRAGYERVEVSVDLLAGKQVSVHRALKVAPKMGAIDLFIDEGWAEVYLKGKKVGRAPAKGLKLPVGKHRLKLVNPPSKKSKLLDVVVDETEVKYYRTRL
jgi:hypothetical protein